VPAISTCSSIRDDHVNIDADDDIDDDADDDDDDDDDGADIVAGCNTSTAAIVS
jgi:hypothetical protein